MRLSSDTIADLRTDLMAFSRAFYEARTGLRWHDNWHQQAICEALERVFIGDISRLIINIPPRAGKTELAVINFMAWAMGNAPYANFIYTSYSAAMAQNYSGVTRNAMQHAWYQAVFKGVALAQDSQAKHLFRTRHGGQVYAAGAGGTITGFGAGHKGEGFGGCILIDDPIKPADATSNVVRNGVNEWYHETLKSRTNSPKTPIILIMQRVHPDDLSGYLLGGGSGETWEHLKIPAMDNAGRSYWEATISTDSLLRQQRANPYVFAGQYQQEPYLQGGNLIRGEWFKRYTDTPAMAERRIFADTAMKTGEHNDYSVFQCWGKGKDGNVYLLDQIRGKWEAPELERRAVAFWNKHKDQDPTTIGHLVQMVVEDKASGTGLIQALKTNHSIPVKGEPRIKDKVQRVNDCIPQIEAGYICLPAHQPWVDEFIGECEAFSADNTHKHDDQIDPMLDAICYYKLGKSAVSKFERMF